MITSCPLSLDAANLPVVQSSNLIHRFYYSHFVAADKFGAGDAVFPDLARQGLARNDPKAQLQEEAGLTGESEDLRGFQFSGLGHQGSHQSPASPHPLELGRNHQRADLSQVGPNDDQRPTADDLPRVLSDYPLAQGLVDVFSRARQYLAPPGKAVHQRGDVRHIGNTSLSNFHRRSPRERLENGD
jgi:hypothetical protein